MRETPDTPSAPPAPSEPPGPVQGNPALRRALWAILAVALVGAVALGLWTAVLQPEPPEPLPVLGEAPAWELTNRDGRTVSSAELAGAPYVVDFIFTRCVAACPVMTSRLATVDEGLAPDAGFHRVSISVDPEHDTPEVLDEYARARNLDGEDWLFLTGAPDEIVRLSRDGFHLALDRETGDPDNPIAHSTRFVLVDARGRIRGYYDAFLVEEVHELRRDLARLLAGTADGEPA